VIVYSTRNGPEYAGIPYRNFLSFLNFIPAFIDIYIYIYIYIYISIYIFPFFWLYILLSILRSSILALPNFHFKQWIYNHVFNKVNITGIMHDQIVGRTVCRSVINTVLPNKVRKYKCWIANQRDITLCKGQQPTYVQYKAQLTKCTVLFMQCPVDEVNGESCTHSRPSDIGYRQAMINWFRIQEWSL
jgi:hypothetical protein